MVTQDLQKFCHLNFNWYFYEKNINLHVLGRPKVNLDAICHLLSFKTRQIASFDSTLKIWDLFSSHFFCYCFTPKWQNFEKDFVVCSNKHWITLYQKWVWQIYCLHYTWKYVAIETGMYSSALLHEMPSMFTLPRLRLAELLVRAGQKNAYMACS